MLQKVEKIQSLLDQVKIDAEKFEKGNSAAGTRVRKSLQEIKTLSQDLRLQVTEVKNSRKG